jgi:hypothetical protein
MEDLNKGKYWFTIDIDMSILKKPRSRLKVKTFF